MTKSPALDPSYVNRAAPPGSMRYFALLYTPEERRKAVTALFAIDAEIRESALNANHEVAHARLGWWRAEIDRLVNASPQHPATYALLTQTHAASVPLDRLHELLVAADMDLARMTYQNDSELRAYGARSGGTLHELIAGQLIDGGALDEDTRAAINAIGVGIRQTEILRDLRRDACDGRIYLPLDRIELHSVDPATLKHATITENVRDLLRSLRDATRIELRRRPTDRALRSSLRPIYVLAALHDRLLDRIDARHYDVGFERIDLGPLEKPWTAWKEARRNA